MLHLDTHVVVWLYQKELDRFTDAARTLIEREELRMSPMVSLELTFLSEIGRLRVPASEITAYLGATIDLQVDDSSFAAVVALAARFDWTRDPFDRIIVAHAELTNSRLLTKDRFLLDRFPRAVW